jgi:mono/diheme cytochrome c family protein
VNAPSPSPRKALRIALAVAALVVIAVAAYLWLLSSAGPMDFAGGQAAGQGGYAGADPTGVPPELAAASLQKRGEYLARAADCEACHTVEGGARFAGGLAFPLPFGTLFSPNITPDRDTGIGDWTDAQFLGALRQGIDDEGSHLYPVFPYPAYSYLTDADALAIKAYLFSLPAVRSTPPKNTLAFPFNQRWLMSVWAGLFNHGQPFRPFAQRDARWNRGAYLVEALEHCGDCHTPRNLLQALDNRRKFAGAEVVGWRAYNITGDQGSGIGAWSDTDLVQYLSTGHAAGRGSGAGPMGEAVDLSLRYLTTDDIRAIVSYLRTVPAAASAEPAPKLPGPAPDDHRQGVAAGTDATGKRLYEGACVSCHGWSGVSPVSAYATLTGARALGDADAVNVVQIVLSGHGAAPSSASYMPAFGAAYSDPEVAAVAGYVVARFGGHPSSVTLEEVAALRRLSPSQQPVGPQAPR